MGLGAHLGVSGAAVDLPTPGNRLQAACSLGSPGEGFFLGLCLSRTSVLRFLRLPSRGQCPPGDRPPGGPRSSLLAQVTGISGGVGPQEQAVSVGRRGVSKGKCQSQSVSEGGTPSPLPGWGAAQGLPPTAQPMVPQLRGALRITLLAQCPSSSASHWGRERNRGPSTGDTAPPGWCPRGPEEKHFLWLPL